MSIGQVGPSGTGTSGYSGISGHSGISGYSGYSGYSGSGGAAGTSGYSGYSGLGTSGYSGYSGAAATINATDGTVPYRSSATAFANSPITRTDSTTVSVVNIQDSGGYWKLLGGSGGRAELNGAISLVWNSTGTPDIGISRHTVGVLRFTDGSTAETLGGTYSAIATTPAQIAANQDNYNPGGSSYLQRWSSDASRNVTGLTFTAAQVSGQTHMICNVGAQDIVLTHDDGATSTAANRFKLKAATNRTIAPDECVIVIYDATTARWRVAN